MRSSVRKNSSLALALLLFGASLPAFADGENLFRVNCANCHANNGSGKTSFAARTRIPDLRTKEVQDMTDDEMYTSIARGTRHKNYPHAYELRGMSKQDIKSIVDYIRSVKK